MIKNLPAMQETRVWSLDRKDGLEKEMATHSSILAWRIPWTEEPGGLQPMGSQWVGHDWATNTHTLSSSPLFCHRQQETYKRNKVSFPSPYRTENFMLTINDHFFFLAYTHILLLLSYFSRWEKPAFMILYSFLFWLPSGSSFEPNDYNMESVFFSDKSVG